MYAATFATHADPSLQRVELIAQNVVNPELRAVLETLGLKVEQKPRYDLYIEDYVRDGTFHRMSLVQKDLKTEFHPDQFSKSVMEYYDYDISEMSSKFDQINNRYQALAIEFLCSKNFTVSSRFDEFIQIKNYQDLVNFELKYQ